MFKKQWVVFASNHKTGFIDFVSSHHTEWGAIRACQKLQERSIREFSHLGNNLVQYYYETCAQWETRGIKAIVSEEEDKTRKSSMRSLEELHLKLLSSLGPEEDSFIDEMMNTDRRYRNPPEPGHLAN
jgi:hypothetical protein